MMKSILLNKLLIPIWITLIVGIGNVYYSFKYDALADVKEAQFKSVEKQMLAIQCNDINKDVLISISRQTFKSLRDTADILRSFSFFLFGLCFLMFINVRKSLKLKHE